MQVIPVLDVRSGQAVRAIAGDRAHYAPLRSVLHPEPDPIALAGAVLGRWGLEDLYLAELDAILGERPPDLELFRAIAGLGLRLWVDAGVREASGARPLAEAEVARVVVGLETIRGPGALAEVVADLGPDAVAFSLDLRDGRPMVDTRAGWETDDPRAIADLAIEAGVRRLIHLDLARVGTGRGAGGFEPGATPGVEWFIGGGVAGADDLRVLGRLGYAGVLVGSALHDGRISAADLRSLVG